jgi:hypothetical protein
MTTKKTIESHPEGLCKGRITEITKCGIHLSNF